MLIERKMNFNSFALNEKFLPLLSAIGYSVPTPIQEQAIPLLLAGRDVMGLAQTGTGKTAAFVLPIVQRLQSGSRGKVRCVVVAPTRELAIQIHGVFEQFGPAFGLRSATVFGGVSAQPQLQNFRRGVDILVACPGRLLDHLRQSNVSLAAVEVLVLDEADHLFDMGFLPNIRAIINYLPKQRQTMLFSATMPDEVRHLALDVLNHPETVKIGGNALVSTVSHALYPVAAHLKTPLLLRLLEDLQSDSVIVFTRTKFRAKRLSEQLLKHGFRSTPLQGNMSQVRRQESLDGFRCGTFHILVATDIAARGIDVSGVSHVINYDMPDTVDAYTHRIGRTGRALHTGKAFTFCTDEDKAEIAAVERRLGCPIERKTLDGFDYRAREDQQQKTEFQRGPRPSSGRSPASRSRAQAPARTGGSMTAPGPARASGALTAPGSRAQAPSRASGTRSTETSQRSSLAPRRRTSARDYSVR